MTPPRDRAIHILNQYDSFTWVPADPGISKSPDYVLLASVVGGELLEIDDVKFTTVFVFVVMATDLPAVGGLRAPPLLGPLEDPRTPGGARGGLQTESSGSLGR